MEVDVTGLQHDSRFVPPDKLLMCDFIEFRGNYGKTTTTCLIKRLAENCLKYMSTLRGPSIFRLGVIPQMVAVAKAQSHYQFQVCGNDAHVNCLCYWPCLWHESRYQIMKVLAKILIAEQYLLVFGGGYNYVTTLEKVLKVTVVALLHGEGIYSSSTQVIPTVVDNLEIWHVVSDTYDIGIISWMLMDDAKQMAKQWNTMLSVGVCLGKAVLGNQLILGSDYSNERMALEIFAWIENFLVITYDAMSEYKLGDPKETNLVLCCRIGESEFVSVLFSFTDENEYLLFYHANLYGATCFSNYMLVVWVLEKKSGHRAHTGRICDSTRGFNSTKMVYTVSNFVAGK